MADMTVPHDAPRPTDESYQNSQPEPFQTANSPGWKQPKNSKERSENLRRSNAKEHELYERHNTSHAEKMGVVEELSELEPVWCHGSGVLVSCATYGDATIQEVVDAVREAGYDVYAHPDRNDYVVVDFLGVLEPED